MAFPEFFNQTFTQLISLFLIYAKQQAGSYLNSASTQTVDQGGFLD